MIYCMFFFLINSFVDQILCICISIHGVFDCSPKSNEEMLAKDSRFHCCVDLHFYQTHSLRSIVVSLFLLLLAVVAYNPYCCCLKIPNSAGTHSHVVDFSWSK